ncbi:MAG: hypothetical protein WA160_13465 [Pseudobdellovibrio sp.]
MKYYFIYVNLSLVLIISTQLQANEKCKQWKVDWSSCKESSDCVVVPNPCGWPTSASNQRSSEAASKCNRLEGASISCPTWKANSKDKQFAECESGECRVKPK